MRVNTNMYAEVGQRNLGQVGFDMAKSVEKLSSGLRINRAGDDAAGLAISEKLRSQTRGLDQAVRNSQDGISMIQTAEGALTEVHSMLQRMRELSVQSANDTLSDTDRSAVNAELQELKTEINGIADRTKFNGKSLLTGSLSTTNGGASASDIVLGDSLTTGNVAVVSAVNVSGAQAGTTYTLTSATAGFLTLTRGSDSVAQTVSVAAMAVNETQTFNFSNLGVSFTVQNGSVGAKTAANLVTDLTAAADNTIVTAAGSGSATLHVGADSGQNLSVSFANIKVDTAANGASTEMDALNTGLVNANTGTFSQAEANSLISLVDSAISFVNTKRGDLGAKQNRLEHTIANLNVTSENLKASESRIRDVDMASEMVKFTRTQILQQAGTAMLAQANQIPQSVLSLLR